MSTDERNAIIRQKVAAGLTPQQAAEVVATQEAWDADPANPNHKPQPAKETKETKTAK